MLPSYHHLSPTQINNLSFNVMIRCSGDGDSDTTTTKSIDIAWQQSIPKPHPHNNNVSIFTYTNSDLVAYDSSFNDGDAAEQRFLFKSDVATDLATTSCSTMAICTVVQGQDIVLCVLKQFSDGLLVANPGLSEEEEGEEDSCGVFLSDRAMNTILDVGPQITTYSFVVGDTVYDYAIQLNGFDDGLNDDVQMIIDRKEEERREKIRAKYESFDCLHEENDFCAHLQLALVSAEDFSEPNNLLLNSFGSPNIVVQYTILDRSKTEDSVVAQGYTPNVQSYSTVRRSLDFVTYFAVAFVGIAFALYLLFGDRGRSNFWHAVFFSIVPIVLIIHGLLCTEKSLYHTNHQFSLMYNGSNEGRADSGGEQFVLELRAYYIQNCGIASLAGCGSVFLPNEHGVTDIRVPTWKPIACHAISETRGRMYDFYYGSACDVSPSEPAPIPDSETIDDIRFFSKAALHTDCSGSIHVRVNVTNNYLAMDETQPSGDISSHKHRVKMRETADEVLHRVRHNKRGRMARKESTTSSSSNNTPPAEKKHATSDRTAKVLERVRSRSP